MEKIKAFRYRKNISVNDFVRELDGLGFQARKLGQAIDVIESMIKDKDCKVFLGVAGALVPGGMKEILVDMITSGWIDVLVITGANLTHDLIEDFGFNHLIGHESMDDYKLNKKGLVRMYNTLMPNKAYEKLEEFFKKNWEEKPKYKVFKGKELPSKIPEIRIKERSLNILDLLVKTKLTDSKAEAKRLILQKGVKIDKNIQKDWQAKIEIKKGLIVQVGKRKFIRIS